MQEKKVEFLNLNYVLRHIIQLGGEMANTQENLALLSRCPAKTGSTPEGSLKVGSTVENGSHQFPTLGVLCNPIECTEVHSYKLRDIWRFPIAFPGFETKPTM